MDRVLPWEGGRMMDELLQERNFWRCFTLMMYDSCNAPIIEVADPNRQDMEKEILRWKAICLHRRIEIKQMRDAGTKINPKYLAVIDAFEALLEDFETDRT